MKRGFAGDISTLGRVQIPLFYRFIRVDFQSLCFELVFGCVYVWFGFALAGDKKKRGVKLIPVFWPNSFITG